jgi:hypothetical protein
MKFIKKISLLLFVFMFFSCNENDLLDAENTECNFLFKKSIVVKSKSVLSDEFTLCDFYTPWGDFRNISLTNEELNYISSLENLNEPAYNTYYGSQRYLNKGRSYKISLSGYPHIGSGIYIAQDIDVFADIYAFNTAMVIPIESPRCGWNPNAMNNRGFTATHQNGAVWTFKTCATRIISSLSGQTINKAIPLNLEDFEWNYAYFSNIYNQ